MMNRQGGFSLIEVLVALLIVSVALMGFLTVQLKASTHTQNATMHAQAVAILMAQSEKLRTLSGDDRKHYQAMLNQFNQQGVGSLELTSTYRQAVAGFGVDCHRQTCQGETLARFYAWQGADVASRQGLRLNAMPCNQRLCLMVAWHDTKAVVGDDGCVRDDGRKNHAKQCVLLVLNGG